MAAAPANVDTFPYTPNDTAEANDFEANYGSGPTTSGSTWTHGSVSSPREGSTGSGDNAWALLPTADYAPGTVSWLHSPIFDLTGQSGLELAFELWMQTRNELDGLKLQVSDDGGTSWTDVTTQSIAYNGKVKLIDSRYGGSVEAWTGNTASWSTNAETCIVNLSPWNGEDDVRFRWCFSALGRTPTEQGPVIDSPRIQAVTSSVAYSGGYTAVPQGATVTATVTKSSGDDFTSSGMTVEVDGVGVTGGNISFTSVDEIDVDFTATRTADVGPHTYKIKDSGGDIICQGTVHVYYPHQLVSAREGGSAQEPPRNGTMGGNGVYLHNGEFRHDLPFLSIPGRMLPLSAGATYRSQLESLGWLGAGWTASFDQRIYYDDGSDEVTLYSGGGRIDIFKEDGTPGEGPYVKSGFFLNIERDDNSTGGDASDDVFTIHYAHGSTATFEAIHLDIAGEWSYRITAFSDRYGNTIDFIYDGDGYLTEIRGDMYDGGSPNRYRLELAYNDHGRLESINDYADYTAQQSVIGSSFTGERVWEFEYNSDARLIEIKLPKTEEYYSDTKGSTYRTRVQFTYDGNDNLLEVIDARQANETTPIGWLKNHYDASDRVDYQDVGRTSSGDTTHRQYIVYDSATDVSVVNAEQHRSQYLLNANGTLDEVKHYTGTWDTDATIISSTPAHAGDPSFFRTQYEYDTEFHVIKVTYPLGNEAHFRYDIGASDRRSRGNLLRVLSDPGSVSTSTLPADQVNGLLATFTYTSAAQFNLLATSVSPRAYVLGSSYDIVNNTGITTDNSSLYTTTNTYYFSHGTYPDGTLQKVTTPTVDDTVFIGSLNDNQYLETVFTYNAFGQVVTSTDQASVETTFVYGSSGFNQGYLTQVQAGSQTTPLVTEFAYNSVGRAITVEDAKNEVYTSYVNQLDQVVRSETPQISTQMSGGSAATYYTRAQFDLNGNLAEFFVSNIDEFGSTGSPSEIETSYVYNILDMATSVTEDIDASTTRTTNFTYDKIFRLTETSLPEGNLSGTDYDEMNRAFKSYFGYGGGVAKSSALITSEVFYDDNSNVVRAVDGRGNDSHYTLDAYDRVVKSTDRLVLNANYTEYAYNQAGQVTDVTRKGNKRYWNGSAYAWTYDATLSRAQYEIDNIGRVYLSRVLAQDSGSSNLGYSALESASNYEAGWSTSRVQFRSNGQVERVKDDLGYETGYEYDAYNRLLRVIDDRDPTNGPSTSDDDNYDEYTYDANGNVTRVIAHLYDDRGPSGDKVLQTRFVYDEINRLIKDTSPSVTTLNASGTLVPAELEREFKYDSRSNLVRTFDRKGVERVTTYDLLNRPIRHKITDVVQRTIDSSGHLSTVTDDIVSRTVYDNNSNVTQSIDTNGNRTYFRYDLAERWLQTQHADGGTGTPLKSTAGTTHTISTVGSTVFYSGTNTYDGNSNLLNLIDENDTKIAFTYDVNDLLTDEDGTVAGGNPFNIEGEAGMEYLYDGLYRSIYGKTHDGTNTLTEVDSVFNTLSGLERQRQRVLRAHPNNTSFSVEQTLFSSFDESGRRHQRTNPSGLTRVSWDFDRKHRPVEELVEVYTTSWQTATTAAQYEYLGGGLLHSRQTRFMSQDVPGLGNMVFPFVSNFERDNLLRLTQVRHVREEPPALGAYGNRLIGRYDYAYNENSMMGYEARWYHDDDDGTSVTPDETDYYFYDTVDRLEKAVYGATKYGGLGGITIETVLQDNAYALFASDTDHRGTFSDRIYYARRQSGTRSKVNWYRGAASGSSSSLSSRNDTNTAPEQTTNYSTSDDPSADADNPAGDGEGSRHNYTVIGQVGMQYDKKRNVIADATREFRYNYRSQLRRVIRKSDDTDISQYREDAYGRRVQAIMHWELGRRVYFDTRFELDVDMDWDGDGTEMKYVDGGITSDDAPAPGAVDQIAGWPSRLPEFVTPDVDTHYVDFHVDIPDVGGSDTAYLGFVAYENYEVRIYGDRYELWQTGGGSAIGTYNAPGGDTKGRHNIGIGTNGYGTWIDGTQALGNAMTAPSAEIRFGTHDIGEGTDGLILLECLTYLQSRDVHPSGGTSYPKVRVFFFDGPQVVDEQKVTHDPFVTSATPVLSVVNPTMQDEIDDSGNRTPRMMLPNGRRTTAVVIKPESDAWVNDEGTLTTAFDEAPLPGMAHTIVTDGTGAVRTHGRTSASTDARPGPYLASQNYEDGAYNYPMVSIHMGVGGGGEGTTPSMISAHGASNSSFQDADSQGMPSFSCGERACACDAMDFSAINVPADQIDTTTLLKHNYIGGNVTDWPVGIQFSGHHGVDLSGAINGSTSGLRRSIYFDKESVKKFRKQMISRYGATKAQLDIEVAFRKAFVDALGEIDSVCGFGKPSMPSNWIGTDFHKDGEKYWILEKDGQTYEVSYDPSITAEEVAAAYKDLGYKLVGTKKNPYSFKLRRGADPALEILNLLASGTTVDCHMAFYLAYYVGLLRVYGRDWFNKKFAGGLILGNHGLGEEDAASAPQIVEVSDSEEDAFFGDGVYFKNGDLPDNYDGDLQGENTAKSSAGSGANGKYTGHYGNGGGNRTAKGWRDLLAGEWRRAWKAKKPLWDDDKIDAEKAEQEEAGKGPKTRVTRFKVPGGVTYD